MFHSGKLSALAAFLSPLWLAASTSGSVLPSAKVLATRQTGYKWVDTWTSMPQLVEQANLPDSPFVSQTPIKRLEHTADLNSRRLQAPCSTMPRSAKRCTCPSARTRSGSKYPIHSVHHHCQLQTQRSLSQAVEKQARKIFNL